MHASRDGHLDVVKYLVEEAEADVAAIDAACMTADGGEDLYYICIHIYYEYVHFN